jgi:glycosyltransferase involved in cell wall biosynthesis
VRILYLADTRFPIERANGVQTMATCHALADRGHAVTLVVREDTTDPPRDPLTFYGLTPRATLTIDRIRTAANARARRVHFLTAAMRRARASKTDVVFTRDLGLAALLLRVPGRPPLVYESHGISFVVAGEMPMLLGKPDLKPSPGKLERLRRREASVWRRAEAYVAITRALADELADRFGPRNDVFVVPDGATMRSSEIGVANGTTAARDSDGQAVAGYAGHLYPWKGIDVLVRALALAPAIHGLIVGGHPGEGDLARVEQLVAQLGIGDRVTITGLVPPAEVAARVSRATMLVLPNPSSAVSERYTSPLKLFEYLSLGRPIIASNLPAFREILTDDVSALLTPAGDAPALAAAMMRLAADRDLSMRLAAGAAAIAPDYTWARRAEHLDIVIARAVRR